MTMRNADDWCRITDQPLVACSLCMDDGRHFRDTNLLREGEAVVVTLPGKDLKVYIGTHEPNVLRPSTIRDDIERLMVQARVRGLTWPIWFLESLDAILERHTT